MKGRRGDTGTRRRGETAKINTALKHPSLSNTKILEPSPRLPVSASPRRILLFGGKGGVGKTTAACAAALHLLDCARDDERILLFSTDPAHSLSDSLDLEIGDREIEVARRGKARLIAREMNTHAALDKFKSLHRSQLALIADRGTLLDESDINDLLDLSLPGMDEVMALFELGEIYGSGKYSRIVVDTAPSGHTTRLLQLPELFAGWITALDRLQEKHRYMVSQFVRGAKPREDEAETFLRDMRERIRRVREMLYDSSQASFTLVTIPEAMAYEETARYFHLLQSDSVPVTDLIINRVEHEHESCRYCCARAGSQKAWLKRIKRDFSPLFIREAPLLDREVRGARALRRFADIVWESCPDAETQRHGDAATGRPYKPNAASPHPRVSASGNRVFASGNRVLLFGGKGGVGKTTAAAATAIAIAEANNERRVLLFSTDPAHSLSDSFDEPVGQLKRAVAGIQNLDAIEVDPAAWLEDLKSRYRGWIDGFFESLTAGSRWEIKFEREAMREVIELAPPGIDEIAALASISNLLDEERYDSIVLDTAPTGHLIRFLELPEIALDWARALIKLLLKYKEIARWSEIAEELVALSKAIKRVMALLTDKENCEFVGVAIAERMSFEETLRLTHALKRLKVPMRHLLINNVVPVGAAQACGFCASRLSGQQSVIRDFIKSFKGEADLIVAPQQPREIKGPRRLRDHFLSWQILADKDEPKTAKKKKR